MPPFPNKQKVLGLLPNGYTINIDDFKRVNAITLFLTCPNGHKSLYPESWGAIKKRISKNAKCICLECLNITPLRPRDVIYKDLQDICTGQGLIVITSFDEFGGRHSRVSIKCAAKGCIQNNVSVESLLEYRSKGCSQCVYQKNKSGTIYGKESQKCTCGKQCIECRIYDGLLYLKHTASQYKHQGIDQYWITQQFRLQKGRCYWSDVELDATGKSLAYKVSIDRINNEKPHTPDNCVLTTEPINLCKGSDSPDAFLNWVDKLADHIPKPRDCLCKFEQTFIRSKYAIWKSSNKDITVTENDIIDLVLKQQSICQISGVDVEWQSGLWNTGSIGRIDPSLPYTIDNLQVIVGRINKMQCNNVSKKTLLFWLTYKKI